MDVVVFGAGFTGSRVCRLAIERGASVLGVVQSEESAAALRSSGVEATTLAAVRVARESVGPETHAVVTFPPKSGVDAELAPLLEDVQMPALFPEQQLHTVWAWLSGPGVRTWLHYDNNGCHNLNAQVTGRKRCVLYAPEELGKLHPFPLGGGNPAHNCSRIDVERPDAALAADLAAAQGWHAELGPGDLLFIPAWWFHTFEHLGELNANVNFWWKPERPRWNVVAARQALVDAATAAPLDLKDRAVATALAALDAIAVGRTEL